MHCNKYNAIALFVVLWDYTVIEHAQTTAWWRLFNEALQLQLCQGNTTDRKKQLTSTKEKGIHHRGSLFQVWWTLLETFSSQLAFIVISTMYSGTVQLETIQRSSETAALHITYNRRTQDYVKCDVQKLQKKPKTRACNGNVLNTEYCAKSNLVPEGVCVCDPSHWVFRSRNTCR